jgi:hypothetical protein
VPFVQQKETSQGKGFIYTNAATCTGLDLQKIGRGAAYPSKQHIEKALMEEINYKGHWWLPDRQQKEVSGILKFSPDQGITLELHGILWRSSQDDVPVILGRVDAGHITLRGCYRYQFKGASESTYWVEVAYLSRFAGRFAAEEDEPLFEHMDFEFDGMTSWVYED